MKFIPAFDMLLVKVQEEPEKTKGGILIPDSSRKKPDEGIILEVGPDVTKFKKGERIVFGKYVGVFLTLEGLMGDLLIHETDVLGVLKK